MPDLKDLLPQTDDGERIRKWREERLRIAEAEKAERLRLRDEARAQEEQERAEKAAARAKSYLPSEEDIAEAEAAFAKRTRKARHRVIARFTLICLLPLAIAATYIATIATPLYEARSVIAVTKPAPGGEATQNGLFGSLNSPNHLQEVFMAHAYIQSQALMEQLENDTQLVTTFSSAAIDPVQRLRRLDALSASKHDQFARFVNSSVDIQTGLITLHVRHPDREGAVAVSDQILELVANQVNTLNADVIRQRTALANKTVNDAQDQLAAAQTDLIALQLDSGEADPATRITGVYGLIAQMEEQKLLITQDIERAVVAGQSQSFQTQRSMALRDRLDSQIEAQRAILVAGEPDGKASLNALLIQHELAGLRVDIAEEALTAALATRADTTQSAALGRTLFQVVVPPSTAAAPHAPHAPSILLIIFVISLAVFALWNVTFSANRPA